MYPIMFVYEISAVGPYPAIWFAPCTKDLKPIPVIQYHKITEEQSRFPIAALEQLFPLTAKRGDDNQYKLISNIYGEEKKSGSHGTGQGPPSPGQ